MASSRFLLSALIFLSLSAAGCASEWNSGKGWVQDIPYAQSNHQALIRELVRLDPDAEGYLATGRLSYDQIRAVFHDLNDDGMFEVMLLFEASPYCGTAGCDAFVYQRLDGKWRQIGLGKVWDLWVSDEKLFGYRTIYSRGTHVWRWDGKEYEGDCTETTPPEVNYSGSCVNEENG